MIDEYFKNADVNFTINETLSNEHFYISLENLSRNDNFFSRASIKKDTEVYLGEFSVMQSADNYYYWYFMSDGVYGYNHQSNCKFSDIKSAKNDFTRNFGRIIE